MKTVIGIILDRSGSMSGRETDVIGGVNKFLSEQKKIKGQCSLGMYRFDTDFEAFRAPAPLAQVADLEPQEYVPRGGTALIDAVGKTIALLDESIAESKAGKVIVLIFTDGEENSSREMTSDQVKALIAARQKKNWTFLYFGANVDKFNNRTYNAHAAASMSLGIGSTGATGATAGVGQMYVQASTTVGLIRNGQAAIL